MLITCTAGVSHDLNDPFYWHFLVVHHFKIPGYIIFWTQARPKLSLIPESARISSHDYKEILDKGQPHILIDVRPAHHFKITALPNSMNIPLSILENKLPMINSALKEVELASNEPACLYVVCRRGNDSQRAVQFLADNGFSSAKDIIGGLESWANNVDPKFPAY